MITNLFVVVNYLIKNATVSDRQIENKETLVAFLDRYFKKKA